MPNKIEEIHNFLTSTVSIPAPRDPTELIGKIEEYLGDIQRVFAQSFQLHCLSSGKFNAIPVFASLGYLKSQLWGLAKPYADSTDKILKEIIERVKKLHPESGREYMFVYQATKLPLWNSILSQRIYIPQGFMGVISASVLEENQSRSSETYDEEIDTTASMRATSKLPLRKFTFLATHGIAPCVGFLLYSLESRHFVLAHFDDPFNASRPKPDEQKLSLANQHYQACIRGVLTKLNLDMSLDTWKIILVASSMQESKNLRGILKNSCLTAGVSEQHIIFSNPLDIGGSILINLEQFNSKILFTYEEAIDISAFPPKSLTLGQALNLSETGCHLYRMVRGLMPCNLESRCYIENDYVTTQEIILANQYFAMAAFIESRTPPQAAGYVVPRLKQ